MLPLEGIRVLDLSRLLPGPSGTMILADLGADVIKVEETEDRGGIGRDVLTPPGLPPELEERHAAYNAVARNKKSIALNLKFEEGKAIFYRLARTADALVESYRPGVVKRLGIDYETIASMNPRLIYCSLSGYGQDGPYRDLPGHDANYQAIAGTLGITHDPAGNPVWTGMPMGDLSSGLFIAIGVLAALEARHKTARGQYIDLAMTDGLVHFAVTYLSRYFLDGHYPRRPRPSMTVLQTKDGKYMALQAGERYFWENLCKALGRPDLIDARRARREEQARVHAEIAAIFQTKTRDEWFEILGDADTCASPVLDINEVPQDPQIQHRQMVMELEHPRLGKVKQIGFPLKMAGTPPQFRSFAPRLGEHTEAILQELGYSSEETASLLAKGVIKAPPPLQ